MVKKRVAYSIDTKNKAVEMKLQGYSTKQIMQELNIKKMKLKQKHGLDGIKMEKLIVSTNRQENNILTKKEWLNFQKSIN